MKKVIPKKFLDFHKATLFSNDKNLDIYKIFDNASSIVKTEINLKADD